MFRHRDGKTRIPGSAGSEPLEGAPFFLLREILAFQSGSKHILEPAFLAGAEVSLLVVEILEQACHRVDGPVANHAIRRLHPGSLIPGIDGGSIGDLIRQFHDVDAEEVLVIHTGPESVAVGFRCRVAAQVVKHAEQTRMRIVPGP